MMHLVDQREIRDRLPNGKHLRWCVGIIDAIQELQTARGQRILLGGLVRANLHMLHIGIAAVNDQSETDHLAGRKSVEFLCVVNVEGHCHGFHEAGNVVA